MTSEPDIELASLAHRQSNESLFTIRCLSSTSSATATPISSNKRHQADWGVLSIAGTDSVYVLDAETDLEPLLKVLTWCNAPVEVVFKIVTLRWNGLGTVLEECLYRLQAASIIFGIPCNRTAMPLTNWDLARYFKICQPKLGISDKHFIIRKEQRPPWPASILVPSQMGQIVKVIVTASLGQGPICVSGRATAVHEAGFELLKFMLNLNNPRLLLIAIKSYIVPILEPYLRLPAAGSNARDQLANGSDHDSHTFKNLLLEQTTLALLEFGDDRRELWLTEFTSINYASQGYTRCLITAAGETSYLGFEIAFPTRRGRLTSSNDSGALDVGTKQTTATPAIISFDHPTIEGRSINLRPCHVVLHVRAVLNNEHTLIGWSFARHGQLGDTKIVNCDRPHIALQHTVVCHQSGRTTAFGSNNLKKDNFIGWILEGIFDRDNDENTLLSTGSNAHGQLGRQSQVGENGVIVDPVEFTLSHDGKLPSLRSFACGSERVMAAISPSDSSDIEIREWGWNEHDNMRLDHTDGAPKPIKIWPGGGHALNGRIA
ncbi:hypothetical protein DFJ58DRAFT_837428 [Suillus subalutaceus]|uniref:uncharacterized protein n=1 Tax=Suillus subalutaceus TaxID=48586 RepID=UPI001B865DE3|nr:uncharacterized protein DFJ58DRAFT_837428 [Suillus subalutaceus]KAG1870706.1 hypothetical protein DFJ58DRAFT_837428 [Suillus subalutaceus]